IGDGVEAAEAIVHGVQRRSDLGRVRHVHRPDGGARSEGVDLLGHLRRAVAVHVEERNIRTLLPEAERRHSADAPRGTCYDDRLESYNTSTYCQAHEAIYDQLVNVPMEELLAELADDVGSGRVFRPNRDIRFSADKSPYKLK